MNSTLPAVAIGLGLAYYTMQTANEGKKEQKKKVEEMINRRVAVDTIEKERETKRDPEVVKFTDTPAKSGMGFAYYKTGANLSKMVVDSGLPFDFGVTRLVGSQEKQEKEKPSDAVATKFIKDKSVLDDGTEARRQAGERTIELKTTENKPSYQPTSAELLFGEERQKVSNVCFPTMDNDGKPCPGCDPLSPEMDVCIAKLNVKLRADADKHHKEIREQQEAEKHQKEIEEQQKEDTRQKQIKEQRDAELARIKTEQEIVNQVNLLNETNRQRAIKIANVGVW